MLTIQIVSIVFIVIAVGLATYNMYSIFEKLEDIVGQDKKILDAKMILKRQLAARIMVWIGGVGVLVSGATLIDRAFSK